MKKTSVILSLLFILLTYINGYSEESAKTTNWTHAIGGLAGMSTGVGIAYRYWPDVLGVEVALTPIYVSTANFIWLSTGVTGLMRVYQNDYSRFFLYAATSVLYNQNVYTNYPNYYYSTNYTVTTNTYMALALGAGSGIEFYFGNFCFAIMYGMGVFYMPYYPPDRQFRAGFTLESSLLYQFN